MLRRPRHHAAAGASARRARAWRAPSRSPRSFPSSPCSRTCASAPRSPAAIACAPGSTAPRSGADPAAASRRRWSWSALDEQGRPAGRRARAWRPARRRDRHGAGAAAASAAARRADRRHGRPGDLRDHPAHPPAASRQQLHHRADRARHAGRVPPRRPDHACSTRAGCSPRARRRRSPPTRPCRPPIWARPHDRRADAAEGLHTYYGKSHILHGVSLEVAEGRITALLGRNGAGKTTTLRSLMGLTPAREGRVTIFGARHHALADLPHRRAAASAMCRKAGASSPISASRRT